MARAPAPAWRQLQFISLCVGYIAGAISVYVLVHLGVEQGWLAYSSVQPADRNLANSSVASYGWLHRENRTSTRNECTAGLYENGKLVVFM